MRHSETKIQIRDPHKLCYYLEHSSCLSIMLFEILSKDGTEHTTTKAYSPKTNGICELFNKTTKQEF
jgi:hypothetical protein